MTQKLTWRRCPFWDPFLTRLDTSSGTVGTGPGLNSIPGSTTYYCMTTMTSLSCLSAITWDGKALPPGAVTEHTSELMHAEARVR